MLAFGNKVPGNSAKALFLRVILNSFSEIEREVVFRLNYFQGAMVRAGAPWTAESIVGM
jgi:hypothetical protein